MQLDSRRKFFWLALFPLLLLTGGRLAAQDVRYNFMPGTDFSKYHTYKWVTIEGASYPNQILNAQIKDAVNSQLAAKGLTEVPSGGDVVIAARDAIPEPARAEHVL